MNRDIPFRYEHRVLSTIESVRKGQSKSADGFFAVAQNIADKQAQILAYQQDMHRESQRLSQHHHDEMMQSHANQIGAWQEVAGAIQNTGDAIDRMSARIGYEMETANRTLERIEIQSAMMNRWLASIANSAVSLIELIKHPREIEALEVANQVRASLAIGRYDDALALAEEAQSIYSISILVHGHLIIAICAHPEKCDQMQVGKLIEELSRLISYRLSDAHANKDTLRSEAVAVIPSVLSAAGEVYGASLHRPMAHLLAPDIASFIAPGVLQERGLVAMCDTPSLLRDLFWWQMFHGWFGGDFDHISSTAKSARMKSFLVAMSRSQTPIRAEIELTCARLISSNNMITEFLEEWFRDGTDDAACVVEVWIRHQLSEAHAGLPADVSTALLIFSRRRGAELRAEDAAILRGFSTVMAEGVKEFRNIAKAVFDEAVYCAEKFCAWLDSDVAARVQERVAGARASEEEVAELEERLAETKEAEKRAQQDLKRAKEQLEKRKKWEPGSWMIGALISGGAAFVYGRGALAQGMDMNLALLFGVFGLYLIFNDLGRTIAKANAPGAVRDSKSSLQLLVDEVKVIDAEIARSNRDTNMLAGELRQQVDRRLKSCLQEIEAAVDRLAGQRDRIVRSVFGGFGELAEAELDAFVTECYDGFEIDTVSARCIQTASSAVAPLEPERLSPRKSIY